MERRIACPGSAQIDNKDKSSPYAEEGTKAHEEAAEILQSAKIPEKSKYQILEYVDYVFGLRGERHIETKVAINSISEEIRGTADCIVDNWPHVLHVLDLKYGAGKIVEVENNAQLATYACGALERFSEDYEEIWITIVQPRIEHKNGPVRTWKITPAELKNWYAKIKSAYERAIAKPIFKEGAHCMWCTGAMECPAAQKQSKAIVKNSEKPIPANNKKLAKLLNSERMILEYLSQAKQEAFSRLHAGQEIPGFKLVRNFGNTTWRSKAEAEKAFMGYAGAWERKLKAIGALKKILPESEIDGLIHRPDKGLALVPESDKRQPYRGAADDFKDEISFELEEQKNDRKENK
jgi:hypothetical protein